jgi:diguanylate cyclase (GGDEF)-like protein
VTQQCTLLAVDDEPAVVAVLKALLDKDFQVLTAHSAAQAREILLQRPVDIVLSDQFLPDGTSHAETGVQLLEWVRQHQPATLRILMTGQASLQDAIDSINRGQVHRFLLKPLHGGALLDTLRDAARSILLERSHQELLERLQQLNHELEERVRQRTQELEELNRQLQHKNSILERMALTDPLTGLPNRRAMERLLRTEVLRRERHPAPLTLLIVDADHFKEINTRYLLPGGDHVLIWLGQVLSQSVRSIDTVGRIGGEEFMILAPDTPWEGASVLAERVRQAVANDSTEYRGQQIRVTISIGGAVADTNVSVTAEQLREVASAALAEAKAAGRNCSIVRQV